MKEEFQKLFKYLTKNKYRLGVFIFSVVFLIITSIFFNFFIMLIIALLINLLWFIPYLIQVKHIDFKKIIPKKKKKVKINNFEDNNQRLERRDKVKRIRRTKERPLERPKKEKKVKNKRKFKKVLFVLLSHHLLNLYHLFQDHSFLLKYFVFPIIFPFYL